MPVSEDAGEGSLLIFQFNWVYKEFKTATLIPRIKPFSNDLSKA